MRTLIAASVVGLLAWPALAQVTFQDGTFAGSQWVVETFGTGSVSGAQVSGGNPGTARQVTNTLGSGAGAMIRGLHRFGTSQATTYEPLSQGAITSLQYAIDYLPISGPTGGQGVAFAIKQGQVAYFAPSSALAIGNGTSWQSHVATLTQADFVRIDGLAGAPDFGAAGARIRFGFMSYNSANGSGVGFDTMASYDNFSVSVVPAPGLMGLAGAAGICAMRRRRA